MSANREYEIWKKENLVKKPYTEDEALKAYEDYCNKIYPKYSNPDPSGVLIQNARLWFKQQIKNSDETTIDLTKMPTEIIF